MIWWCLLLLPGLLYAELRSRQQLSRLASDRPASFSPRGRLLPDLLALAALGLVLLSLQPAVSTAIDTGPAPAIALVVDVSLSMQATDQHQQRMSLARNELLTIIENLHGSRFALLPFAGEPVLQVPLTDDLNGLRFFIDNLQPGLITAPGSGPEEAVQLAQRSLEHSKGERLIILVSDGERTLAGPPPQLSGAIPVYSILTGTAAGSPVGASEGAISRADPQRLAAIARQTGGKVLNGELLTPAAFDLPLLKDRREQAGQPSRLPALVVTLLLLALRWVPAVRTGQFAGLALLTVLILAPGCGRDAARGDDPRAIFAQGLQAERRGEIESAILAFAKAAQLLEGRQRAVALYNQGTLLLANGQEAAAIEPLEQALCLMPGDAAARDNLLLALAAPVAVSGDRGDADRQESGTGTELSRLQAQQLLDSVQLDPLAPPAQSPHRPQAVLQEW